jgi:hypothetical protein
LAIASPALPEAIAICSIVLLLARLGTSSEFQNPDHSRDSQYGNDSWLALGGQDGRGVLRQFGGEDRGFRERQAGKQMTVPKILKKKLRFL